MAIYEYVPVKEFARRAGFGSVQAARNFLNSPNGLMFKRQRGNYAPILANWTKYQEYMETQGNPSVKYAGSKPGRPRKEVM